jgi:hypothetical protein
VKLIPWTVVRRTDLDALYETGRAAGLATAERVVDTLAEPIERGDLHGVRLLFPVVLATLAAERADWQDGGR